jgi:hypothetical protein
MILITRWTSLNSALTVARLCVTIGHYWYLFKRLKAVSAGRFYRFEHIVAYSSGKVVAKSDSNSRVVKATPTLTSKPETADTAKGRPNNFNLVLCAIGRLAEESGE